MSEKQQDSIKVLWTGGWDSTYRVLSLAKYDVVVEPYYLVTGRKSQPLEVETMNKIRDGILSKDTTRFTLKPVNLINEKGLQPRPEVSAAYDRIRKQMFMGIQYKTLGWLADTTPGLELCIHRDDKAFEIIETLGAVRTKQNAGGEYAQVDPAQSPEDLVTLFGAFHFPLLDMTKLDMKAEAEKHGFIDLMNETWFCFSPIDNKPCGLCNPCKYTIEEGMAYRFSNKALTRYKYRNLINFPKRVVRKVKRVLKSGKK